MSALEESIRIATIAAKAADEKKADDIAVIDVSDMIAITDCFVVASADNERQVGAIVEEIEDEMTKAGFEPKRREGNRENRWVLLDYGLVVIHVQRQAEREFYGLDRLYRDCPLIEIEDLKPSSVNPPGLMRRISATSTALMNSHLCQLNTSLATRTIKR